MEIKFFKKRKSFKKGGIITNPGFFWSTLLVSLSLLILVALVFGFLLFKQINNGANFDTDMPVNNVSLIDKTRLEKVLEYFSSREKKSLEILNSPAPVVDPSR